jgi:hypothetical protein
MNHDHGALWNDISKDNRSTRRYLSPRFIFFGTNIVVFIGPATQMPKQCFRLRYNFFFPHPMQFITHYNNPIIRLWKIWAWLYKPNTFAMTELLLLSWLLRLFPRHKRHRGCHSNSWHLRLRHLAQATTNFSLSVITNIFIPGKQYTIEVLNQVQHCLIQFLNKCAQCKTFLIRKIVKKSLK